MGTRTSAPPPAADHTAAPGTVILAPSDPPAPASRRTQRAREKIRWYAVWKVHGNGVEDIIGVHEGDISAWWAIEERLAGGQYHRGQHLRRYGDLAAAVDGFYAEAERHGCALPVKFMRWPLSTTSSRATRSLPGSTSEALTDGPEEP